MKTNIAKICMAAAAHTNVTDLRTLTNVKATRICLLTLSVVLSVVLPMKAGNTVSVSSYVPVTGSSNGTTNTGVAYESCSAVNGADFAEVSAYAFYGSNQIVAACSILPEDDFNGQSYAAGSSDWSDTLVINGQSPVGLALFRFNLQENGQGTAGGGSWFISSSAGPFYTDVFPVNSSETIFYPIYFTNGIPFSMEVFENFSCTAYFGNGNTEFNLTGILLPDGASISSLSGINWLTNVTIIHPSLSVSQSGTNVVLHWFGFNTNGNQPENAVETTTDLTDPNSWQPTGYTPVQTGDTEFTLTYPMDSTARFFRLK